MSKPDEMRTVLWSGIMDPALYAGRDAMLAEAIEQVKALLGRDGLRAGGPLEAWTTDAGYPGSTLVQVHVGVAKPEPKG